MPNREVPNAEKAVVKWPVYLGVAEFVRLERDGALR
jgi:hypothetical protein